MKIAIHILGLDEAIEIEKGGRRARLPGVAVMKRSKKSVIRIGGEDYDAAILIYIVATYKLAEALGIPFEEMLNWVIVHELCHILNPGWEHDTIII